MPLHTNYIIELPGVEFGVVLGLSSYYISKLGVLFILKTYVALIYTLVCPNHLGSARHDCFLLTDSLKHECSFKASVTELTYNMMHLACSNFNTNVFFFFNKVLV